MQVTPIPDCEASLWGGEPGSDPVARSCPCYWVVDGNLRLAAARVLGDACPPLKAEIVDRTAADQLLTMVVANTFRYDVDPVSEALHYQRLRQEEKLSVAAIGERTGVYPARVQSRLELLKLDPPIQELVAQGLLPVSPNVVAAFLSVPDANARIQLAQRIARPGVRVKIIESACATLAERLAEKTNGNGKTPMRSLAVKRAGRTMPETGHITRPDGDGPGPLRRAAQAMCQVCALFDSASPEPAWALVAHAADTTCDRCNLRDVAGSCKECPGVELLRRLIDLEREHGG